MNNKVKRNDIKKGTIELTEGEKFVIQLCKAISKENPETAKKMIKGLQEKRKTKTKRKKGLLNKIREKIKLHRAKKRAKKEKKAQQLKQKTPITGLKQESKLFRQTMEVNPKEFAQPEKDIVSIQKMAQIRQLKKEIIYGSEINPNNIVETYDRVSGTSNKRKNELLGVKGKSSVSSYKRKNTEIGKYERSGGRDSSRGDWII